MVSLKQYKVKGNSYWSLIHSVRKGNKVIQKKKYLGKKLPDKTTLEELKKEFLFEIKKGKSKYFSKEQIKEIEEKKIEYLNELKRISRIEQEKKINEFMIRFTYDSSKLSGVDITLRQTFLILEKGIIPDEFKNLRIAKELENHEKGFIMITNHKGIFDINFIKKLHKILMQDVDNEIAGKTRDELKKNVKISGTSYVPPKHTELKNELKEFFNWYKTKKKNLHPIEIASLVHLKLISLQPFGDGNSRLSRLLMNWILWKNKYPMIDIPIEDLNKYYNVLDYYQIEKNEKHFVMYILERYLKE